MTVSGVCVGTKSYQWSLDHPEADGSDHVSDLCPMRAEYTQRRGLLPCLCGVGSDAAAEAILLCPMCSHTEHDMGQALARCGGYGCSGLRQGCTCGTSFLAL